MLILSKCRIFSDSSSGSHEYDDLQLDNLTEVDCKKTGLFWMSVEKNNDPKTQELIIGLGGISYKLAGSKQTTGYVFYPGKSYSKGNDGGYVVVIKDYLTLSKNDYAILAAYRVSCPYPNNVKPAVLSRKKQKN